MEVQTYHYEFNNDSRKCTNVNLKLKLDERISSIVEKEGYITCDVTKKILPSDGGNYLANLYEIDVKGKTADGDKETSIFVKEIIPNADVLELISIPDVYKTEMFFYNELTKIFNELQDESNVPKNERYNTVKYYEESNDEAIIMENVTKRGFKTYFRMDVINLDMAEESVKQLARFHGLSFVLEQKRPDYFASKIKTMKTPHQFGNTWNAFANKFYKMGMEYVNEDLRCKIKKKILDKLMKMEEYYTDQSIMYCLCHGDYRSNNIMVKEVDGNVTEAIPVDYQLIYYGCPIIDFLYFVYMGTDLQFRRAHMTNLKNLYYQSLDGFLQHFEMSAESVLPREVFENLYQEKLDYGLVVSFMFCPFLFASEDEVPDLTKGPFLEIEFKSDDRIKDRLNDAVEEFLELGYL